MFNHQKSPAFNLRIQHLLATTEVSMADIARRMGCSDTYVIAMNARLNIRPKDPRRKDGAVRDPSQIGLFIRSRKP